MSKIKFPRPGELDCSPYYFRYIDTVAEGDIVAYLQSQQESFGDFIAGLKNEQLSHRYAEGKWSLAEMIGHVLDTERVFAYRMMCISRGETKDLPGFEQDDYVSGSNYHTLSGQALYAEWKAARTSTILLCQNMSEEMAARRGMANNTAVAVNALPWMMAGHINHHLRIATERYI